MFPGTQHPLMGGEVLVAPRVGRAAVYAEAVCSPTTVLCPSVLSLYCALSICLPACWCSRGALRARSQSHACARARSPIPLAIGRGETIADIVQREFKAVCLSVCLSVK